MPPEVLGWAASAILLATLIRQIATQAKDATAKGVSRWLFIVTNSCILVTAIVGQVVTARHRRRASKRGPR